MNSRPGYVSFIDSLPYECYYIITSETYFVDLVECEGVRDESGKTLEQVQECSQVHYPEMSLAVRFLKRILTEAVDHQVLCKRYQLLACLLRHSYHVKRPILKVK